MSASLDRGLMTYPKLRERTQSSQRLENTNGLKNILMTHDFLFDTRNQPLYIGEYDKHTYDRCSISPIFF